MPKKGKDTKKKDAAGKSKAIAKSKGKGETENVVAKGKVANAPKKPMTAFFWYMKTRREALKKEEPDLNNSKLNAKYNQMADDDKTRYANELKAADFKSDDPPAHKDKDKDQDKDQDQDHDGEKEEDGNEDEEADGEDEAKEQTKDQDKDKDKGKGKTKGKAEGAAKAAESSPKKAAK